VANIPAVASNGLVSSILMPLVLSWINSAPDNAGVQNRWQMIMVIFAVIAFVGCFLEYFFTRERITEEDIVTGVDDVAVDADTKIPTRVQLKAAASDKFWWIIMIFYMFYQAGVMFKGGYVFNIYCHEFFSDVTFGGIRLSAEMIQSVLALISGIPLAAGMLFIWPLANKFGKKNMIIVGCVISIVGSLICISNPSNFTVVLVGQTFKGFSSVPGAYIMMALFADVLDHLEARFGFRVDGVSMSVYNAILTVVNGLAVAFFNFFYDNANFASSGVAEFFFVGYEVFAHAALIVIVSFLTVEKNIVAEQALIAERKAVKR
jgi:GPH family glycoside/pentoside/hexuronide:cation symporter